MKSARRRHREKGSEQDTSFEGYLKKKKKWDKFEKLSFELLLKIFKKSNSSFTLFKVRPILHIVYVIVYIGNGLVYTFSKCVAYVGNFV